LDQRNSCETYTLTLRQAVDLALQQNPDLIFRASDEQRRLKACGSQGSLYPRIIFGSAAAYTSGYPLTIDGNPPSILQGHAFRLFSSY